jgi:DNA replication protein DnaC
VQFLKGGATGELEPLQTLGATFYRGKAGQKFVFQMNEEEKAATRALQTENLRRALAEPADLLILDEFLLSPVSTEQTRELLEIIEARSVKGSVIFCTQFEPKGWYSHIGSDCDATTCEAIIDRIIHKEDFII